MDILLYFAGAAVCVFLVYLFFLMPAFDRKCVADFKKILSSGGNMIAHRGLHGDGVPENSLEAFRKASAEGYSIEFDIALSKDGVPVIFHDENALRMCGVDRKISDMTLSEIKELSLAGTCERVPTLEEALSAIKESGMRSDRFILAEYKPAKYDEKLCPAAAPMLEKCGLYYAVESFNPMYTHWYQKNMRGVVRGQLTTSFTKEEKKKKKELILLEKLLVNVMSRPDFISRPCDDYKCVGHKICVKWFKCLDLVWTPKPEEKAKELLKTADGSIFER